MRASWMESMPARRFAAAMLLPVGSETGLDGFGGGVGAAEDLAGDGVDGDELDRRRRWRCRCDCRRKKNPANKVKGLREGG